jgi:hypothetical protein
MIENSLVEAARKRDIASALKRADDVRAYYADLEKQNMRPAFKTVDGTAIDLTAEALITLAAEVRRLTPTEGEGKVDL